MGSGGRHDDRLRLGGGFPGGGGRAAGRARQDRPGVRVVLRGRRPGSGLDRHRGHRPGRRQAGLRRGRRVQHRHTRKRHRERHRRARERREHGRPGGEGEPRRQRAGHQVAHLRADRLGRVRPRRADEDRQVRAHLGQRPRRTRPAGLDAEGFGGRRDLADAGHPLRGALRRALPDQDVRTRRDGGVPALPAGDHQEQRRRRRAPARRRAAGHRRHRGPHARGHALLRRRGPGGLADREGERRVHRHPRAALRGPAHRGRPGLLVQQGLRRERRGRPAHRAVVQGLPVDGRRRPRLRRHERLRRPRLHRRHLPERPQGHRPARVPADAARSGRRQDPLREPVEQREVRDRFGRRRQDRRPDPAGVRLPQGPGEVPRLAGRRGDRAGRARASQGPPVGLRAHHPRHQLQRQLLARQQLPRDRRAARLQLLDAGDQRRFAQLDLRVRERQQRRQPAHRAGVLREPRAEPLDG
ncbi:hypothetical protein RKD31_005963 [Streptomyces sp. SAI-163]